MKTLNVDSIKTTTFPQSITSLLHYCNDVTNLSTKLLAGKWRARNNGEESDCDSSPSFADMDVGLDEALKDCISYKKLSTLVGHLHCRELLLSFCWLNLKAVSFIMADLGRLSNMLRKTTTTGTMGCEILTTSNISIIEAFFQNTLIRCRHKGVIENSLVALTKFTKAVSSTQWIWDEVSRWCDNVLKSSTDSTNNSSVTGRRFVVLYSPSILLIFSLCSIVHQIQISKLLKFTFGGDHSMLKVSKLLFFLFHI